MAIRPPEYVQSLAAGGQLVDPLEVELDKILVRPESHAVADLALAVDTPALQLQVQAPVRLLLDLVEAV